MSAASSSGDAADVAKAAPSSVAPATDGKDSLLEKSFYEMRRTGPYVLAWAVLSVSLSMYNSEILNTRHNRFPYPFFYTLWHMVVQTTAMSVVFCIFPSWQRPTLKQFRVQWRLLIAMALACAVSVGGENYALTMVTLTVHESMKSAVPVLTMCFAFIFESRYYSLTLILAVVGLASSTVAVQAGAITHQIGINSALGIIVTGISSGSAALRPVIIALLLREQDDSPALTPLVIVWYEGIFTGPVYLAFWACTAERDESIIYMRAHLADSLAYIGAGCAMAFFYAIAVNWLIRVTSSLTTTVLGTVKHVTLTCFSAILVDQIFLSDNPPTLIVLGLLGYIPAIAGYSYLMLTHQAYNDDGYAEVRKTLAALPGLGCCWRGDGGRTEGSALLSVGTKA